MKKITLLTWVGLIVNLLTCGVLWFNFVADTDPGVDFGSTAIWFFSAMAFSIALIFQAIALLLLPYSPKWGRVCAIIGVIVTVPIGLLFLIGYLSSYEKITNASFTSYSPEVESPNVDDVNTSILLKFKTSQMFLSGVLVIAIGVVILVLGVGTGGILVGAGILALVNAFRLKGRVIIGLTGDKLIVTPGIYSETYTLPLKDVTIVKSKRGYIKFRMKNAGEEKVFTLRKNIIDSDDVNGSLSKILPLLNVECTTEHKPI